MAADKQNARAKMQREILELLAQPNAWLSKWLDWDEGQVEYPKDGLLKTMVVPASIMRSLVDEGLVRERYRTPAENEADVKIHYRLAD